MRQSTTRRSILLLILTLIGWALIAPAGEVAVDLGRRTYGGGTGAASVRGASP